MLSRDIFSHCIIPYFRGNISNINNLISPISEKEYNEYLSILKNIKQTCCFSTWYKNSYNNRIKYLISINNSLLFHDINHIYLQKFYNNHIDSTAPFCHHNYPIQVNDFHSLYPTIMIRNNLPIYGDTDSVFYLLSPDKNTSNSHLINTMNTKNTKNIKNNSGSNSINYTNKNKKYRTYNTKCSMQYNIRNNSNNKR